MARTKTKSIGAMMVAVVAKAAMVAVMMLAAAVFTAAAADDDIDVEIYELIVDEIIDDDETIVNAPTVHANRRGAYVPGTILLQTRWGMHAPFNKFHPTLENGNQSRIGCNHIAASQIVKYHEWPQIISGNIPAYTTGRGLDMPEIVRNNFSYDWANMKNNYNTRAQGDSVDAVATLMYHVSLANRGNYTLSDRGGGGTSVRFVAMSLVEHFNYDDNIRFIRRDGRYLRTGDHRGIGGTWNASRDSILPDIWDDVMRLQIDSLLPVFFWDAVGGHAMVLDGYNNDGRFHFNMGWRGHRDGWYLSDSIFGPRTDQAVIINIMPNRNGRGNPTMKIFGRNLRARNSSNEFVEAFAVNGGTSFSVNPTIYNIGTATSPAGKNLGIALYTSATDFVIIGETTLDETLTFTRAREPVSNARQKREDFNLEISSTVPSNIPQGDYVLRAVMKNANDEWEVLGTVNHYINEMTVCVGGSICTAAPRSQPVAQTVARDTVVAISTSAPTAATTTVATPSSPTTIQPARLTPTTPPQVDNVPGTWANARNTERFIFNADGSGVWHYDNREYNFTYTATSTNIVLTMQPPQGGGVITRTFSRGGRDSFVDDHRDAFRRRR